MGHFYERIMMQKIVIVDVDAILWDFESEMMRRLEIAFPDRKIERATHFKHCEQYFENYTDLMKFFGDMAMDQEQFKPFTGAKELLETIRDKGYFVHIASNRLPNSKRILLNWLDKHELYYDEVYADHDKTELFDNRDIVILIDDKPDTQDRGLEEGMLVLSLEYPYNQHQERVYMFSDLTNMLTFFKDHVKNERLVV
jgi:hypothetical protein